MKAVVALLVCASVASAEVPREVLRQERELLDRGKKNSLTWEHFPLQSFPAFTGPWPSQGPQRERIEKRLATAREKFVKKHLRGRLFGGPATITAIASGNGKYVITAAERYDEKLEATYKKMRELDAYRAESTYAVTGRGSPIPDEWDVRHTCTWSAKEPLAVGDNIVLHGEIENVELIGGGKVGIALTKVKTQEH